MGLTKSEIFTSKQNRLALLFKALAHPARMAIIQQLLKMDTCFCGDLVSELGLAQSTISQHLLELKKAGLIKGTVEGVSVCYCIDEKTWNNVKSEVESLFISCSVKNKCC
ncbi:MAG: winged helix-turn-helix transcriptional regulator [Chitinophagaceae bacterium]|nr:winged helix-turn-helix transcriptional regulator [Chitinophagaceae bacterium]MBK9570677.1 winged helix-turn-helix transcriptional regulator [Chitinophagaceae bacterium]MBL0272482.1 winged helix-turn-helix transcriptional regulator [Chitinophagaceae bacterium]